MFLELMNKEEEEEKKEWGRWRGRIKRMRRRSFVTDPPAAVLWSTEPEGGTLSSVSAGQLDGSEVTEAKTS